MGVCKVGEGCRVVECTMLHPEGRDAEQIQRLQAIDGRANITTDMAQFDEDVERIELEQTWYPGRRDCTCCHGYVYNCADETCVSLGICGCCAMKDDDPMGNNES